MLYRIVPKKVWADANHDIPLAPIDERDGYIHLSSQETVLETANLYFTVDQDPVVLCFEEEELGDGLRWEEVAARNGVLFPHLYASSLLCMQIAEVKDLNRVGGRFSWGKSLFVRSNNS